MRRRSLAWQVGRRRGRCRALGTVGAILIAAARGAGAQAGTPTLTVQPRTMSTGTQNPAAGVYSLDAVPSALVSVPPPCVGAHRCPLFLFLPGGGQSDSVVTGWLRPVADRYGMILLAASAGHYSPEEIDVALKETLRRFSVDPEEIAVVGRCASGPAGMALGVHNLHVFSRIASISGGVFADGMDPQNKTAEFLIDISYQESRGIFKAVKDLRRNGNPVKLTLTLRGHEHQAEDYDFLGRWLHESWTTPPARRPPPWVVAESLPLLTPDVLKQMTTFWTSFFKEPDSIRTTGRWKHIRDVVAPVGPERPVVPMVDMAALAAEYPSVATALTKAGLTAQQHDAYRIALITAMIAQIVGDELGPLEATSVLAKNLAFINQHADELETLATAGIDDPSRLEEIGGGDTNPTQVEEMGPLGIWRTP